MSINIWTAKIYAVFKIIGFVFLYMHVTKYFVLIYISYICIYVILIFFVFILKTDERGE
jgi:hypothetical protein